MMSNLIIILTTCAAVALLSVIILSVKEKWQINQGPGEQHWSLSNEIAGSTGGYIAFALATLVAYRPLSQSVPGEASHIFAVSVITYLVIWLLAVILLALGSLFRKSEKNRFSDLTMVVGVINGLVSAGFVWVFYSSTSPLGKYTLLSMANAFVLFSILFMPQQVVANRIQIVLNLGSVILSAALAGGFDNILHMVLATLWGGTLFFLSVTMSNSFNELLAARRLAEEQRDALRVSEEKRRELEVKQAIDSERTRMMREMHDGIGSNLVTALSIAEQQQQPATTIKTLKRAISDLRITIDSLEPVNGDLSALLANFRHRMKRDFAEAGLVCRWKAEPCPPLPWLDATNALHVLRIFQEAIGNALSHAKATELEIGCAPVEYEGRAGVRAWVADNGRGFISREGAGKGLTNMRLRAEALHGAFECHTVEGRGTRIHIWLPIERILLGKEVTVPLQISDEGL